MISYNALSVTTPKLTDSVESIFELQRPFLANFLKILETVEIIKTATNNLTEFSFQGKMLKTTVLLSLKIYIFYPKRLQSAN